MSEERINELINLIKSDRSLIDKLNFEELDDLNKYLLKNNIKNILSIIDIEKGSINE